MGKRAIVLLAVFWMLVVVAGVSSAITMSLCGVDQANQVGGADGTVIVTEREYEMIERYGRLEEIRGILEDEYYTQLDEAALLEGAARGMLEAVGDPYTSYFSADEMMDMAKRSQGVYEGVGMLLSADKEGRLCVLRLFKDSPAIEAGVKPGDIILEINGEKASADNDKQVDEAVGRIKSAQEEQIQLTIQRGGDIFELSMPARTITINRVDSAILEGGIGYIEIYEFLGDDVIGFQRACKGLQEAGVRGLIIDLRSNPGGLLDDVVQIADALLPSGLIVYTQDREGRRQEYYSDAEQWKIPMVVLVNHMSASASEILTGALKDYGLATVVGETTYGKGIVQTVIPFRPDSAGMRLTTATYYTPKGRSIHGVGIEPDVIVQQEESFAGPDLENDLQLQKAYEILTNG